MKKSTCIAAVFITALVHAQADDSTVKTVSQSGLSSKSSASVTGNPTTPRPEVIPANLRDNPADNIPFPQPASGFKDNPNPNPIKIGPMPDSLNPMGPAKPMHQATPVATSSGSPTGGPDAQSVDIPARAVVEIPQATEKTPSAGVSQEVVTTSPFLDWIQNTKNAAEIAKQQRQAIEQNDVKDRSTKDSGDQDLFLHIRFPYVGNQDLPPSGGSVTYSIPQR